MNYLGDFAEDTIVRILFTTHDKEGGTVAPSSAFETDDFHIYKDSLTEKLTVNGLNISSPFAGLHALLIDTSVDTGDAGFWVTGSEYFVVLDPDETVDGESVVKVVGSFSIERTNGSLARAKALQTTVGAAGAGLTAVPWNAAWDAQVESECTDALNAYDPPTNAEMIARTLVAAGYATAANLATVDGKIDIIDGIVDAILVDTSTTLDTKINTIDGIVDAILVDTDTTIPGLIAALPSVAAILDDPVEGAITLRQALRVMLAYLAGRANGGGTATINFRDQANTKNRISMSVDSSGNRSAVTLDVS
jgi:hypothetical protein